MFLRASSFVCVGAWGAVALVALSGFACKARNPNAARVKDSDAHYDDSYKGPDMFDPACAADGSKCNCFLRNEFDKFKDAPEGSPEKKQWYRQCIGQTLWTFATGTSSRFHTYYTAQKTGVPGDYGLTFHTDDRAFRFKNWGLVNDPNCCVPRSGKGANDGTCPDSVPFTKEDTYGFDYCPGDDVLLTYVGAKDKDYTRVDPACNIGKLEERLGFGIRPNLLAGDTAQKRSDSCFLEIGTSAGAVGFRKFPNPRFDKEKWRKLNGGSMSSWINFSYRVPGNKGIPDYNKLAKGTMRLADGSVEPPFHLSQSCGSCHVGFAPTKPPTDPANPKWENIQYAIGNIFIHDTELHTSGAPKGTFEHEYIMYARPGTVDTSAATNDYVYNPGTFNALINLDHRPALLALDSKIKAAVGATSDRFIEEVSTWRRDASGKFEYSTQKQPTAHILKGGEDSNDVSGGVMRVYANIFSCTETCLANHLDDPRAFSGRGSRQTPFDLDQCRRDCPGYSALEDRVYDVLDFLLKVRPNDLKDAKDPEGIAGGVDGGKVVDDIMQKKTDDAAPAGSWYEAGKQVYGDKCAKCHSSQVGQDATAGLVQDGNVRDIDVNKFMANVDKKDENGVRTDWLGSDVLIPQKVVNTVRCRAMHSNHMAGHLWEGYASDTYRSRERYNIGPDDMFDYPEEKLNKDNLGGRGFYRNVSLLNAWAHAPFMHNNGVGYDWSNPFLDIDRGSPTKWKKLEPNPSVKTRLDMYRKSMEQLFQPEQQRDHTGNIPYKVTLTAEPVTFLEIPVIPELPDSVWGIGKFAEDLMLHFQPIKVGLPAGMPVVILSSIRLKQIMNDLMEAIKNEPTTPQKLIAAQKFINGIFGDLTHPDARAIATNLATKGYANCADIRENGGHEFADLNDTQKAQLIDFMLTL